jgi:hypothetical protein
MDAWSWDDDRIDRCSTHVIRPDGELDSFCRYYSGFPGTWRGPRRARRGRFRIDRRSAAASRKGRKTAALSS